MLNWVRAEHPAGTIRSAEVTVPVNAHAELLLPVSDGCFALTESGQLVFRSHFVPGVRGIEGAAMSSPSTLSVQLSSGEFEFLVEAEPCHGDGHLRLKTDKDIMMERHGGHVRALHEAVTVRPDGPPATKVEDVRVAVDVSSTVPAIAFPHTWKESVGSGHALLGTRADWRAQLRRAKKELGYKRVRMHGVPYWTATILWQGGGEGAQNVIHTTSRLTREHENPAIL